MISRDRGLNRVVGVKEADQILDLLVGDDSADEQDVRPLIVELAGEPPVRRAIEVREIRHDRQHGGPWKAKLLEILPVEFRIAQRQVAPIHVRPQLPPTAETLPRKRPVDADEVLRRRDVVIDERHPIGQRECGPRRLGAERKVMEQQVVGMAEVDQLAVVASLRFEAMVCGLDEDL